MNPPAPATLPPTRLRVVMALVTGAMFMEILDGTIITTALPAMAQTFGTTAVALNIGVSAYLLALGVFIPASGWVADRFGARRTFAVAITLFTLSSALCGMTASTLPFVAFRVAQGIAGAMMVPVGRLVVMRFTPKDRLMAALSSLVWPALIAPVLGPPIGGWITTHLGWRWIFFLNVPIGVVALAAAIVFVPDAYGEERRRFDWRGFLLCGLGTFALLAGLERMTERIDAVAAALLAAGGVLLAIAIRHLRRSPAPLLALTAFSVPTYRAAVGGGSLARMAIGAVPFLLPLMFQAGFGYDAFHSGLLVLALFAGNLGMKTATTPVLRRFGYRPVLLGNGMLCVASLVACAVLTEHTPVALTVAILFAGGLTRSMQFTTMSTLAFSDVPRPAMSDANGLFAAVLQTSSAAAVALAAVCVRACTGLAPALGFTGPGAEYRCTFLFVALVAALGLIDAARLPRGAGDHFVAGRH